ncbi:MAG: adenylate cyclase [Novosphingobium sp.]|nr:adenylate cyclase [Novosphingobium sp.]
MNSQAAAYRQDQAFFLRLAIAVSVFVVFAFAQWALRGYANYATAPIAVHVHGITMLAWLGLFIAQNYLATSGNMALHRKLGWTGVALAAFMLFIGTYITLEAVAMHRVPPLFTNAYFLMLGPVHLVWFAILLGVAIALRRKTEWHRRLMLAATVTVMEPAFGRLILPPVLMSAAGPWVEGLLQAALLGVVMVHDRRIRGAVHPALWWGVAAIFASVLSVELLSRTAPVIAWAQALSAGS